MIYQKSYVPPNTVGFKQGNLGSVFRVGYKAAGQVLSLGNKAKQFYEKYGAHVPQVAEKVRELEPYFNKAMEGAAKVTKYFIEKAITQQRHATTCTSKPVGRQSKQAWRAQTRQTRTAREAGETQTQPRVLVVCRHTNAAIAATYLQPVWEEGEGVIRGHTRA